jgi:hypothetical protein
MANLSDKFTIEELKDFEKRINNIFYQATHGITRENSNETERQLLLSIDQLSRVSGMLCDLIEQQIDGHIETHDPKSYIDSKLGSAETWIRHYLEYKNINL